MNPIPDPQIPLFPLGATLFPGGRMPLQIFEPRYLDLVSRCMRDGTGFGVVLIQRGSEVYRKGEEAPPQLVEVGCYARIVDWDGLPNNRLGITIEGGERFTPGSTALAGDRLLTAQVTWWEPEPAVAVPSQLSDLLRLLQDLLRHPMVERLGYQVAAGDAARVGCQLAQLLPIRESDKLKLLLMRDPLARLEAIDDLLQHIT